jgi:hypothetical protein
MASWVGKFKGRALAGTDAGHLWAYGVAGRLKQGGFKSGSRRWSNVNQHGCPASQLLARSLAEEITLLAAWQ